MYNFSWVSIHLSRKFLKVEVITDPKNFELAVNADLART